MKQTTSNSSKDSVFNREQRDYSQQRMHALLHYEAGVKPLIKPIQNLHNLDLKEKPSRFNND